jgi:hypothetical protein
LKEFYSNFRMTVVYHIFYHFLFQLFLMPKVFFEILRFDSELDFLKITLTENCNSEPI